MNYYTCREKDSTIHMCEHTLNNFTHKVLDGHLLFNHLLLFMSALLTGQQGIMLHILVQAVMAVISRCHCEISPLNALPTKSGFPINFVQ